MSVRLAIESVEANLEESLGIRAVVSPTNLSPAPRAKDASRRPVRDFGTIDVDKVSPDPFQPRKDFDDEALEELAESIKSKGQLQPVRLRWSDDINKWIIVAGERRWRAAKKAGLKSITCYFHEGQLTKSETLHEQIIENFHRRSLQPIEEARAFSSLMEINDWNGRQVAESLGIHPAKVSRALSLLKLPVEIQNQVESGDLAARTAYEVSKLNSDTERTTIAADAKAKGLTAEQTANIVRRRKRKRPRRQRSGVLLSFQTTDSWKITVTRPRSGNYYEVEQALQEALDEVRHRINNNVQLF